MCRRPFGECKSGLRGSLQAAFFLAGLLDSDAEVAEQPVFELPVQTRGEESDPFGRIKWNQNRYEQDPDSKIHKRCQRPESEWLSYRDNAQRIVSDELWDRCCRRRDPNPTAKLECGARPRFLLSGS